MPDSIFWPSSRFREAAKQYRLEFQDILHRLTEERQEESKLSFSPLRKRLGDFIGRAIRFYLRKLFNSIPIPYTTPSDQYIPPDLSLARSDVHKIVQMETSTNMEIAVADGSISSIFSLALRRIHECFRMNGASVDDDFSHYISSFCESDASKKGFGKNETILVLSKEELQELHSDVDATHVAVAGAKASEFVCNLMKWPGVENAIKGAGGWGKIELYATIFSKLNLDRTCPEEAHFALLKAVNVFLRKLKIDYDSMKESATAAEINAKLLWKRFRCGSRNQRMLRKNPSIVTIRDFMKEREFLDFPTLTYPSFQNE